MPLIRTARVHFDGREAEPYLDDGATHYPPINAGADFAFSIEITYDETGVAYDLTGATAQWNARYDKRGATETWDVIASISTGLVVVLLTDLETAALGGLEGVHQLELTLANGDVHRIMEGRWKCSEQVTA